MSVSFYEIEEEMAENRQHQRGCFLLNPECRTCVDPVCKRRDEDEEEEGED